MATGGDSNRPINADEGGWERALGRKDRRHCRVTEAVKVAYEEVEARGCSDLAYSHQVPYLQVSIVLRSLCRTLGLFVMMFAMIPGSGVLKQIPQNL